jgi:putative transposase
MIDEGRLVTLKGPDPGLFTVEKVVDRERSLIRVRAVLSGKTKDVDANDIVIVTDDELAAFQEAVKAKANEADDESTGDDTSIEQYALAQDRYNTIKKFHTQSDFTREQVCAELNIGRSTFYTLLEQFDESVGVPSMLVKPRGRAKGSSLLSEDQEDLIVKCYNKWAQENWTIAYVYTRIKTECDNNGIPVPSLSAVRKRLLKIDPKDQMRRREGKNKADDVYVRRSNRRITRALQEVQLDHTLADIFLRSELDGRPLGRPYLSLAVDTNTGVILGFHLSFDPPSSRTVSNLLLHALMPKTQFMDDLGLGGLFYPYYGKPEVIFTDNAKEFRAKAFRRACAKRNIKVKFRQSKQAGGKVERTFGTLNTRFIHLQRGTTLSRPVRSRDFDPASDSVSTYGDFLLELTKAICQHNDTADYKGKSPARRWREQHTGVDGKKLLPESIMDPKRFALEILPEFGITCTNTYAEYRGIRYEIGEAKDHTRRKILIKPDALNIRTIWAYLSKEDRWVELDAVEADTLPRTMAELQLYRKLLDPVGAMGPEAIKAVNLLNEGYDRLENKFRRAKEAGFIDEKHHQRSNKESAKKNSYKRRDFSKRAAAMHGES